MNKYVTFSIYCLVRPVYYGPCAPLQWYIPFPFMSLNCKNKPCLGCIAPHKLVRYFFIFIYKTMTGIRLFNKQKIKYMTKHLPFLSLLLWLSFSRKKEHQMLWRCTFFHFGTRCGFSHEQNSRFFFLVLFSTRIFNWNDMNERESNVKGNALT